MRDRFLVDRDERGEKSLFPFPFPSSNERPILRRTEERLFPRPTAIRAAVRRWGNEGATAAPPSTKGFMLDRRADSTAAGVAAGGRREAHREGKMARGGKREREKVDCPGILRDVPELGAVLP